MNSEAEVVVGDRAITVRPHACARSACLEKLLREELRDDLQKVDFLLCFANVSYRDEDVFETLLNLLEDPQTTAVESPVLSHADDPYVPIDEGEEESDDDSPGTRGDLLGTPRRTPFPVQPGELPPAYDWVPTAQRERDRLDSVGLLPTEKEEAPIAESVAAPAVVVEEDAGSTCACYTLSLGMKKTKAQHALPAAYHVQNLIRAMAARLPTKD